MQVCQTLSVKASKFGFSRVDRAHTGKKNHSNK